MKNIQNISLHNDGQMQRISITWDEIDDEGKTTATNKRITRAVVDEEVKSAIDTIMNHASNIIEEV